MKSVASMTSLLVGSIASAILLVGCGGSPSSLSFPSQTAVTVGEAAVVMPSDLAPSPEFLAAGVEGPVDALQTNDTFIKELLRLTNQERRRRGLAPLELRAALRIAANNHAKAMATKDFFSHTNPFNGSTPTSRARAQGYQGGAGENIAAGYTTPASVFAGWMNSSGHRANILNPSYKHIGVGYYYQSPDSGSVNYYHYWVQVFGLPY